MGEYQKAYDLINSRKFHPWEGGEGKVTSQYLLCRVELAKIAIREGRFAAAVRLLKETATNSKSSNVLYMVEAD